MKRKVPLNWVLVDIITTQRIYHFRTKSLKDKAALEKAWKEIIGEPNPNASTIFKKSYGATKLHNKKQIDKKPPKQLQNSPYGAVNSAVIEYDADIEIGRL